MSRSGPPSSQAERGGRARRAGKRTMNLYRSTNYFIAQPFKSMFFAGCYFKRHLIEIIFFEKIVHFVLSKFRVFVINLFRLEESAPTTSNLPSFV
jgi:hypothetical protein